MKTNDLKYSEGIHETVKTRKILLPYGKTHITLKIPERNLISVLEAKIMKPLSKPINYLEKALKNPISGESLSYLAERSGEPCIIVSDSTRPTPSGMITEAVLSVLNEAEIPNRKVIIVIATGLHRPNTIEEIRERLGDEILKRVKIVNHDAHDEANLINVGRTSRGTPVWINKLVQDCDLIIGDGYIEPHFFAGYTGGGKTVVPGVSGLETIKVNHGACMIDHPQAKAGVLHGNPIYEDIIDGAELGNLDFSINVTLDPTKKVSGIFAGKFKEAHIKGARFLEKFVKIKTPKADIAITTNGGYPLDRDLYQGVKGMTVGEAIVKEGGVTVIVSDCIDGVGHPKFRKLVEKAKTPEEILETIRTPSFFEIDQWEAQILARVLTKCDVVCVTGVESKIIRNMHMTPARDMSEALKIAIDKVGKDPDITVVPGGPSIIPDVI